MKQLKSLFAAIASLTLLLFAQNIFAETNTSVSNFSPEQTQAIQQIVHDYLIQNPQVLIEVANKLQQQQQSQMQKKAIQAIVQNAQGIFNSSSTPVYGNQNGPVTLVEFYDYQCPHCKTMNTVIANLVKNNPQLRVVYKEFPIFPNSDMIAKAALAAQLQSKFVQFHDALMQSQTPLTQKNVMKIAKSVGLNTNRLRNDMNNSSITDEIRNNTQLAQNLGLVGTPAFIIASNINSQDPNSMKIFFVPGEVSQTVLEKFITQATKEASASTN